MKNRKEGSFLTLASRKEPVKEKFDVILVTADAYVDHPSFGSAVIGRYLESLGLNVALIARPDYKTSRDFRLLGAPSLFFGVTAGNLDSLTALYTSQRKIRSTDAYSPGGETGARPYLPSIVYTNRIKESFKGVPVILGGLEASLRRISHYDYYQNKVRRSVLLDSKADMLVYGNGEAPLSELVSRLRSGERFCSIKDIRGTAVPVTSSSLKKISKEALTLPSHKEVSSEPEKFSLMTKIVYENLSPYTGRTLLQEGAGRGVKVNPPAFPLKKSEIDRIYRLPFQRKAHPYYLKNIPALTTVKSSIISHRGCYGGCSFCSLSLHQGKFIQSRSLSSIIREAEKIAGEGYATISDIGGPTANMYGTSCRSADIMKRCRRISCLYPQPCPHLNSSARKYLKVLSAVKNIKNIKNVYISSGIRCDLALKDKSFIQILASEYVPGHLSAAPEHICEAVLKVMGKPSSEKYEKFKNIFKEASARAGRRQYLMPYFIVGHPGADSETEAALASYIKKEKINIRQVQEFCPSPMTASTSIYFTSINPFTGEKVYAEKKSSIKKKWKNNLLRN